LSLLPVGVVLSNLEGMNSDSRLAWGIIGTGRIAQTFAKSMPTSRTGKLVAVASRTQATADTFVGEFPKVRAHGSYEALLNDPEIQAVYISTPHPMHVEWAIRAARAGKHILCEKPFAMNHAEAMAAAEAARQNGVFLMEAFMYRCHPQTARAVEIVRSGRLGELRLIEAVFAFDTGAFLPESRLFRNDLGGGAILDVGCYCMSMVRLLAGAAEGKPCAEPIQLKAIGTLGQSGVDEQAQALLTFPKGLQARLVTAIRLALDSCVTITGSKAVLRIPSPWFCGHPTSKIEVIENGKTEEIEIAPEAPLYSLEIDTVGRYFSAGEAPCMPIDDTLGNMAALDRWRNEIGLVYETEKLETPRPGLPSLRKTPARPIPNLRAAIPGLDPKKPVSRMVLGTMLEGAGVLAPHGFALFDYFFEHGGNIFDTAYGYGAGAGECTLGEWMRQRGVRNEITVLVKGAHTPCCDPINLRCQFLESLDRLQTGYADIYMLHRDNLEIPVGEFVDVLNEQVRAGRLGIFGGSNWSLERIDEANEYARQKGLQGFGAVSNQFSLARMVKPVWPDCLSASDPTSRAWHAKTGIPLFAWSSQARGFFIRGARDYLADRELVDCWYSEDNFERLARVQELAREKKTEPVHIAAAYVLHQPFPVFALVGPRKLSELASSFQAFDVVLSPEELAWLNLESDSR
jgi:predicted dehydrogenase/aryl-alcohol dehydrogenase-like predicted oxidoreductase